MIWDLIEQSQFNQHFSNQSLTITQLLLDQNIITQLKNQNPQLLDYLHKNKHQFIKQMIDYVILMPNQNDSYDRCYRLPYISSQLLALNSDLIYSEFFKKQINEEMNEYWIQLIGFLDDASSHNEILIGYFQKVINNLYNGNKVKTCRIISIHLSKFIPLISNGSIGDILKNCIILLTIGDGQVVEQRLRIVESIITNLIEKDEQRRRICSNILIQIINKFQTFSSGQLIISKILNSQQLLGIYNIQKSTAINQLLIGLINKAQQTILNQHDQVVHILTIPNSHIKLLIQYLKTQSHHLEKYTKSNQYIKNQSQKIVRKSPKQIYSILNLINLTIQNISDEFVSYQLIKILWNLLGLYPFNNILHVIILKIFLNILKKSNQKVQHLLMNHYQSYILELAQINLQMFRPLLFKFWNQAKMHKTVTTDKQILQKFQSFVDNNLQTLLKYEINKNSIKGSQRKSNMKLVVDEQDSIKQRIENQNVEVEKQQKVEIIPYKFRDQQFNKKLKEDPSNFFGEFNFDQFKNRPEPSKNDNNNNVFGSFDSFF